MEKEEFLKIVSKFDREEFRQYLYKSENKKEKLITVIQRIDKDGNVIKEPESG